MNYLIRTLTTPSCWIRNHKTSKGLSEYIQDQLKGGELPVVTNQGYCVSLGNKIFWASNYPYAFGAIYQQEHLGMPDRKTVFMLWDALQKTLAAEK